MYDDLPMTTGRYYEDRDLLAFIGTLSEEPDKSFEEAAQHSGVLTYPMPDDGDIEKVMKVQEARIFHEIGFIAGAKWQKEQKPAECRKDALIEWAKFALKCQEEELAKYDGPSYMKASTMGRIDAYKVLIAKLNSL
jgi:hypothetical protein